jgi:hypothetical protein
VRCRRGSGSYRNKSMSILLSKDFIVGFTLEIFLCSRGLRLMQPNNIILLAHFITVDGAKGGGETTETCGAEHAAVLDAVVWFSGEGGADHAVDYAGAAVGYHQRCPRGKGWGEG